jgi:hypothetical protein
MEVVISHDIGLCPIVQNKSETHNVCWRLRPRDSEEIWIEQLFSKPFSGEQIYGLLSSCEIAVNNMKHTIELIPDPQRDKPGFCVFHEESWIRSLFRKYELDLQPVPPGAFLRVHSQRWIIEFTIQENQVVWTATSDITNLVLDNRTFEFTLNPMFDLKTAKADFIEKITGIVLYEKIANPDELLSEIDQLLERYGFGDCGPECHAEVSLTGKLLKIKIKQLSGSKPFLLNEDIFEIDNSISRSSLLEGLSDQLASTELNITNIDQCMQELATLVEELGLDYETADEITEEWELVENHDNSDESIESELLEVIEEYRNELDSNPQVRSNLGYSLTLLSQHKFEQGNLDDALEFIDESIMILSEPIENDYAIGRRHVEALITKCEFLLSAKKPSMRKDVFKPPLTEAIRILKEISPSGKISSQDKEKSDRIKKIAMIIDLELPL